MKPSERIDQLWAAMNIGVGRSSAIVAYLDEQAAADVDTSQASYKRSDGEASPPTPDRYQEAIASRYAGGDTISDLASDYKMRSDVVQRAIRVTLKFLFDAYVVTNPSPYADDPAPAPSPGEDKPRFPCVCPCALVGPCEPNCTCADSFKSGGCRRCASYGGPEQRLGMAQWIANELQFSGRRQREPDEARAELTRLKAENARLVGSPSPDEDPFFEAIACAIDDVLVWNSDDDREGGDYPARIVEAAGELARLKALLEDWELFGATVTGCTNHSGRVALDDAKAQMDTHLRVMTSLVDIQRERAEKAEGEITRLKAESARLREDDAAQRKLAAVLGMENIPDTGPTWPASWEALISRVSQLATETARLDALNSDLRCKWVTLDQHNEVLKENARLSGELTETQTLLLAATNQRDEACTELTWERGWDLLRKAQMGAVVEAARDTIAASKEHPEQGLALFAMAQLELALSALDQPSQPEPANSPGPFWVEGMKCNRCGQPAHHNGGNCGHDYAGSVVIVGAQPERASEPRTNAENPASRS